MASEAKATAAQVHAAQSYVRIAKSRRRDIPDDIAALAETDVETIGSPDDSLAAEDPDADGDPAVSALDLGHLPRRPGGFVAVDPRMGRIQYLQGSGSLKIPPAKVGQDRLPELLEILMEMEDGESPPPAEMAALTRVKLDILELARAQFDRRAQAAEEESPSTGAE